MSEDTTKEKHKKRRLGRKLLDDALAKPAPKWRYVVELIYEKDEFELTFDNVNDANIFFENTLHSKYVELPWDRFSRRMCLTSVGLLEMHIHEEMFGSEGIWIRIKANPRFSRTQRLIDK